MKVGILSKLFILSGTTFIVALYVVNRLILSPIVTRPAAQQQHRVSWVVVGGVGWGGPGHYVVTPTRVEVKLRLSWAVTTSWNHCAGLSDTIREFCCSDKMFFKTLPFKDWNKRPVLPILIC